MCDFILTHVVNVVNVVSGVAVAVAVAAAAAVVVVVIVVVVDQACFIQKWPCFAKYHGTFAKLSRTPSLVFSERHVGQQCLVCQTSPARLSEITS